LIWAAANGITELVQTLVDAGADKSLKDCEEMTALDRAKEGEFTEIIQILSQE
jgi:ankyrin repeat protein